MPEAEVKVTFLPSGKTITVEQGTTLMQAAIRAQVEVDAVCGGKGTCGKCRAKVSGEVSEPTQIELGLLSSHLREDGVLLLCQRRALGDVAVRLEPGAFRARGFRQTKGALGEEKLEHQPPVRKHYQEFLRPTIADQRADLDRILESLPKDTVVEASQVREFSQHLREGDFRATTVLYRDRLLQVEAGNTELLMYGIAFDIGTTTVAGYLVDLAKGEVVGTASATNAQRRHGGDVISRITFTLEEPGGLQRLQELVAETVNGIIGQLLKTYQVKPQHIYALTFIGNTVMSHLLAGASPVAIASAPFVPAFSRRLQGRAADLGLKEIPGYTPYTLLPNIAGYVGSDTVGVILGTRLYERRGAWLAIDIGTNGEIVLSQDGEMLSCSAAAGPAFEGAAISQGMRAEPGAIYKVNMRPEIKPDAITSIEQDETIDIAVVGDKEPVGLCGSGLVDALAGMVNMGLVKSNGRLKSPEECSEEVPTPIRERLRPDGRGHKFVLFEGEHEVAISQKDISELQLAKGAIKAGIDILMEEFGLQADDLDGILLAGAFGSNLRPESVKAIGMLPDVELGKIQAVGNAAGLGAVMALLSTHQLELADGLARAVGHRELSLHHGFQRKFAKAITF